MKLMLINPARFTKDTYIFPPIHLLYIAQAARQAGHEAEIVDVPYLLNAHPDKYHLEDESVFDLIFSKKFDVVGIGSVVSSYFYCEKLVKKIRERRKNVPVIVGGSVGLPVKDVWARNAPADFICESDGELVIQRFLNNYPHNMDEVRKIPGLHYFDGKGSYIGNKIELSQDLDYVPFLTCDETDTEYFIENGRQWIKNVLGERYLFGDNERFLPFVMSRGCVYSCTFCFHFHNMHRRHSPKYIADHLELLMKKHNVTAFQVIDDLIIINKPWLHAVCDEIIKRKLNVSFFSSGGKPGVIDIDLLKKMKQAGFKRISYGVESGSQTMLDVMRKRTTVKDNAQAISWTREAGIPISVNIVFGMPGESVRTMNETRDFLIGLDLSSREYYAALATPYPGSPLYDEVKVAGMITDTREYLFNLGGYGDYKHNMTAMAKDKFLLKVMDVSFQVDRAYYLKRRQYKKVIELTMKHILRSIFYRLPVEQQNALRPKIRALRSRLQGVLAGRKKGA
jgi:radical SAM superfamily enzyme YgiQ (UPF0313 family)